jgi:hypothetical protein
VKGLPAQGPVAGDVLPAPSAGATARSAARSAAAPARATAESFSTAHRAAFASALLSLAGRVRGVFDPATRSREREYQRRLAQHRDEGRHVEAYLFVLDRSGDGRRA